MESNTSHFNIFSYIKSKLEENPLVENEGLITIILNKDNNGEPYIEIAYKNEDGDEACFTKNFNNLSLITDYASNYSDIFNTYDNDSIVSIIYDNESEKLNLIRVKNGNYTGKKYMEDYDLAIFVGYIIEDKKLSKEEKIKLLYENIMEDIMDSVYQYNYQNSFIFMVGDQVLNNIYMTSDFIDGVSDSAEPDVISLGNIEIIEEVFEVKLQEKNKQKKLN